MLSSKHYKLKLNCKLSDLVPSHGAEDLDEEEIKKKSEEEPVIFTITVLKVASEKNLHCVQFIDQGVDKLQFFEAY